MDILPIQGMITVFVGALAFILVMGFTQFVLRLERNRSKSDEDEH